MIVRRVYKSLLIGTMLLAVVPTVALSAETAADSASADTEQRDGLTYLVPSLEDAGYRVSDGKKKYKNRISFSPGIEPAVPPL